MLALVQYHQCLYTAVASDSLEELRAFPMYIYLTFSGEVICSPVIIKLCTLLQSNIIYHPSPQELELKEGASVYFSE